MTPFTRVFYEVGCRYIELDVMQEILRAYRSGLDLMFDFALAVQGLALFRPRNFKDRLGAPD